ncbi:MAG: Ig family protein, partial [Verrucomicrobia bacterium]|nr:Ig family protein [Verrucomicrobiota bacterium]
AGGAFTTAQPNGAATSTTRNHLARFNADGSLDTSFDPNVDRPVLSIGIQSNGLIVIGGGFTLIQPSGATTATLRNSLARLNPDGSLDTGYDPNLDNGVVRLVIQPDGKVVAAGYFTGATPNAGTLTTVSHIARFNIDGTLDIGFNPGVGGNVLALTLQANGGIILGGSFSAVQLQRRNNVARLNSDGSVDVTFDPNANFTVYSLAEQSDGGIILGGNFTQLQPNFANAPTTRNHIARVNTDGSLDSDFNPDTNGRVLAVALQADGKALVGGSFTSIGGVTRNFLARLNADGTLDASFDPNLNGHVSAIALQADGNILIGGNFTTVKGAAKLRMARLFPDGSLDTSFEPNPDNNVSSIAIQPDKKILIGGNFLSVRPNGSAVNIGRNFFARINSDGSLDSAFNPVPSGPILAIKLQADGKILVGGNFLTFATGNRANIARINQDGTLDAAYNPSANKQVNAIVLQSDGKIVIGGAFTFLQPYNAPVVTITTTNADGTVTKSQTQTSFRRGVARLNTDGTVDPNYDPGTDNVVRTLSIQADQKVIMGGLFIALESDTETVPHYRTYIARVGTDGKIDDTFDLHVGQQIGNQVITTAIQADGKIILGGAFTSLQPAPNTTPVVRNQIARVNSDGTIDAGYNPGAGGPSGAVINSLTVQPDGHILVGGVFSSFGGTLSTNLARFNSESIPDTTFQPDVNGPVNAVATRLKSGTIGTQLSNFAWLNANGTLRTAFSPPATTRLSGQISALAVQSDGKILLGGGIFDLTGTVGGYIVRLNTDGSLDTTFNPKPDGIVTAIAVQPDGAIVIGGSFLNVGGLSRQYVARLASDGTVDATFNPTANSSVNAIVIQSNGYVVLGGSFTSIQPNGASALTPINYLARVKADGTYDNTFNPNPNSSINSLALQPDGALVVGGSFTTMIASSGSTTVLNRNHIARIKPDNTVDTTFDPGASSTVLALAIQSDGKIVLGGNFAFLQANGAPTIVTRNNLARINSDGSLDATFDPNPNNAVTTLAIQPDGKIVVGGLFSTFQPPGVSQGIARNNLARLNSDGTLDSTFSPNPNGPVVALSVRPDGTVMIAGIFTSLEPSGSIIVGGSFSSIGGAALSNLAVLTNSGSAAGGFAPNPNGAVYALASRPDNRVVVAGSFTSIAGVARPGVAQLNADGTIDTTYNAGPSATGGPAVLLLQPDGKVIVGGSAVGFAGVAHGTLERLNADGSLDASFTPIGLGAINALALQSDGRILVGGVAPSALVRLNTNGTTDSTFAPVPNGSVSTILIQSDGRIIVGGAFTTIGGSSIPYLARLNATGTADTAFSPNVNGAVTASALTATAKVLFGGSFTSVSTLPRYGLARLSTLSPAFQTLSVDPAFTTVTWTRTGSGPALVNALFEESTDGRSWTTLGQATRVGTSDTWQLAGQTLPANTALFIRARGTAVTSIYGSSGVVESVRAFYSGSLPVTPQILSATVANGTSGANFYYGILTNVSGATFGATGLPAGLTVDPTSGIIRGTTSLTGTFPVTLTATTSAGTATTILSLIISAPAGGPSVVRFVNLSARAPVTTTDPLIAGLVVTGTTSQTLLLRAVGPGLAAYGVAGIPNPHMSLYNSANALLYENAGWGGSSALTAVFNQVGAFPLTANSTDAAMLVTLQPGRYSVVVTDAQGAAGIALAEVYDTGTDASSAAPRLVNISARSSASTAANTLIGGFVVSGSATKKILIRGVGPALGGYGVTSFMADPILNLYDANGVLIAQNDNWGTPVTITSAQPGVSAATLTTAFAQAGGFPFAAGSADAAIVVNLPPGTYSAQVKSVTGATGTALVEIYEAP